MKMAGLTFGVITLVLAAQPGAVSAQAGLAAAEPGNWSAWHGCWRAASEGLAPGGTVCVLPGEDALSARIATVENGAITQETVIRADGVSRPVEDGGCTGEERAFFSADGRRVYTRAELTCARAARISTGVLGFAAPDVWIDAQALNVRDQHAARAIRYLAMSAAEVPAAIASQLPTNQRLAQETARLDASMALDIPAVAEASREVGATAVEAFLAERTQGFHVDAAALLDLQRQGIPASTIDVMVALSYPERFAVRQRPREDVIPDTGAMSSIAWMDTCYRSAWISRRYSLDCYGDGFGYGYYSPYSRFGYSPWGYDPYGWRYGNQPIIVITNPNDDGQVTEGGGRVIRGRGYTPSEASSTSGGARRRPSDSSTRGGASSSGPGTSSPSAGPSDSNSSGGGGSSTPARTAKPRGT
jgi:hypothetical protein